MPIDHIVPEEILEAGFTIRAVSSEHPDWASSAAPVSDSSQSVSRSELKFSISEETAARIREAASRLMTRDPYCSTLDGIYEVHTVYLDSPDMAIYRKSLKRGTGRFKLRMRFYDDNPCSPVFLEIKESTNGQGTKKRCAVDRETANALFPAGSPCTFSNAAVFEQFWETVSRFNARPVIHIGYLREAFVGRDSVNTRLTLDRMIRCQPAPMSLTTAMNNPVHIWQGKVILEIKFVGEMPAYFRELIRGFGLESAKTSKYMESIRSSFGNEIELRVESPSCVRQKRTGKHLG